MTKWGELTSKYPWLWNVASSSTLKPLPPEDTRKLNGWIRKHEIERTWHGPFIEDGEKFPSYNLNPTGELYRLYKEGRA